MLWGEKAMACVWTAEPTTIYGEILKFVGWGLTTLGGAFIGSFLGSYMKKKGENRAIHEDIEKLVDQVRAVTTTTKEIEAKISGEVWDRQKRWELKRDVLFEATKRVAIIFDRLKNLDNVLQTEIKNPAVKDLQWKQLRIDENNKWFEATAGLEESKLFIGVSCGMDLLNAVAKFAQLTSNIAGKIYKGDGEIFKKSVTQLFDGSDAIRNAIRKELAIDGGAGSGS